MRKQTFTLAAQLKLLRGRMPQREVERRAGMKHNTYTKYETGVAQPPLPVIGRLAAALDTSPDELLAHCTKPVRYGEWDVPPRFEWLDDAQIWGGGPVATLARLEKSEAINADEATRGGSAFSADTWASMEGAIR